MELKLFEALPLYGLKIINFQKQHSSSLTIHWYVSFIKFLESKNSILRIDFLLKKNVVLFRIKILVNSQRYIICKWQMLLTSIYFHLSPNTLCQRKGIRIFLFSATLNVEYVASFPLRNHSLTLRVTLVRHWNSPNIQVLEEQ